MKNIKSTLLVSAAALTLVAVQSVEAAPGDAFYGRANALNDARLYYGLTMEEVEPLVYEIEGNPGYWTYGEAEPEATEATEATEPGEELPVVGQDTPHGEENTADTDPNCPNPEVISPVTGVVMHKVQQGDIEISGYLEDSEGIAYVIVEKNGVVIGEGPVDENGYYFVKLTEAVQYGNILDIYGVNKERQKVSNANFGEHEVELVAPNQDPTPVVVYGATSDGNVISGHSRPFDKIVLVITNELTQKAETVTIMADENGDWEFQSSTLVRKGYKVEAYSVDSAGNKSETIKLKVDDTSALEAPAVRRAYDKDQAVTIQSEPYALVELEYKGVIYRAYADANGIVRFKLDEKLAKGEEFIVRASIRERAIGETTYRVSRSEDNVKPVAPTVDTIAEGQTLLTGTAEPFTLIQALWTPQKTMIPEIVYAIANEEGNWFIDLVENCLAPFEEGQKIYVRSYDNALNFSQDTVETVVDATKAVPTSEPILVDPNNGDINQLDPNDTDNAGELPVDSTNPGENSGEEGDKEGDKEAKKDSSKSSSKSSAKLPETGEATSYAIFGAAALSILAGLGLVAPKFNKEN